MQFAQSLAVFFLFGALTEAHVFFPFSEVIQANDLDKQGAASPAESFQCDDGCRVYTDLYTSKIEVLQDGNHIAYFNDFAGKPKGYDLKAGKKYQIKATGRSVDDFVFYAVSINAPNYDSSEFAASSSTFALPITANAKDRYITILSSYNAVDISKFTGTYPSGYPKIYATGSDALSDVYGNGRKCTPVYQARSQKNAEQSQVRIYSPIMTVDFGFVGTHGVTVNRTSGDPSFTSTSSTVYMSPGYVGCNFELSQVYYSPVKSVSTSYQLFADSLDIAAIYNDVQSTERVDFKINQEDLGFFNLNSSSFTKSYRDQGVFGVELYWTRKTSASSWTLQLDFGEPKTGASLSIFIASIVVFLRASTQ